MPHHPCNIESHDARLVLAILHVLNVNASSADERIFAPPVVAMVLITPEMVIAVHLEGAAGPLLSNVIVPYHRSILSYLPLSH